MSINLHTFPTIVKGTGHKLWGGGGGSKTRVKFFPCQKGVCRGGDGGWGGGVMESVTLS